MRRLWVQLLLLWGVALIPAAVAGLAHPRAPSWSAPRLQDDEILLADALRLGRDVLWLDARTAAAFDRGHIPGSLLLNEDRWEALVPAVVEAWRPGCTIVVYCDWGNCDSSRRVAGRLASEMEWDHIYLLHGGWDAWARAHR
jgi:rhodanese-related sulfurtransferase